MPGAGCAARWPSSARPRSRAPIISWVADHRKHHAFSDEEGDPHSPHVGHGGGWRGALKGLWHAHVGWLFIHTHRGNKERYAPDLLADPLIRWVDRTFVLWVAVGLLVPFVLGYSIGGSLATGARPACCGAASCACSSSTT